MTYPLTVAVMRRRSRLDSFIARLTAQRDSLDHVAGLIGGLQGPVLELGLGNGRTFDHLRTLFPERDVFAFDRAKASHPSSTPDDAHLVLGDFRDTIPVALDRIGAPAALVHCDFGDGDPDRTAVLARFIGSVVPPLVAPGGIVLSDQPLAIAGAAVLTLPACVPVGRYFGYVRDAAGPTTA